MNEINKIVKIISWIALALIMLLLLPFVGLLPTVAIFLVTLLFMFLVKLLIHAGGMLISWTQATEMRGAAIPVLRDVVSAGVVDSGIIQGRTQ